MAVDIPQFLQTLKPATPLSVGEREVLTLLSQGLDVPTMATQLETSLDVIRRRLSDIYKKLAVEGPAGPNGKLNELKKRLSLWESEIQRQQLEFISPTYGRESDLVTLRQWLEEGCRLLAIHGVQGIGKTALAAALFQQLQQAQVYEKYFWISPCPPFAQLLEQLLKHFEWSQTGITDTADLLEPLARLVSCFRQHRCLLVIDQAESLLEPQQTVGQYRVGYQLYSEFFKQIGEQNHASTVVLTSLERLPVIEALEVPNTAHRGDRKSERSTMPVRSWQLSSLSGPAALRIIEKYIKVNPADESAWLQLAELYQGNPASIKMAVSFICEFLNGNVQDFLSQDALVFGDFSSLIAQQLQRLSTSELDVVKCLADQETGMTLIDLVNHMNSPKQQVMTAIQSLRRRSFLTRTVHNDQVVFTLPPLISEYAQHHLVQ